MAKCEDSLIPVTWNLKNARFSLVASTSLFFLLLTGCSLFTNSAEKITFFHDESLACSPVKKGQLILFGDTIYNDSDINYKIVSLEAKLGDSFKLQDKVFFQRPYTGISSTGIPTSGVYPPIDDAWDSRLPIDEGTLPPMSYAGFGVVLEVMENINEGDVAVSEFHVLLEDEKGTKVLAKTVDSLRIITLLDSC